jgi:hypothetical protein
MHIDLKFVKSWGAYNAGEIARFAVLRAQPLLERGVAVEHRPEEGPQTKATAENSAVPEAARPPAKTK